MIQNKPVRILAVAPLSRGLGYAVMEGPTRLVASGNKAILGDKNAGALAWVQKFIQFYQPDVLVLPDVNARDTDRYTPLLRAARGNHATTVRMLLDHGADVNARAVTGYTALM